ncbi:MAG: hypothetical protein ACK56I_01695, partial [bacterium]
MSPFAGAWRGRGRGRGSTALVFAPLTRPHLSGARPEGRLRTVVRRGEGQASSRLHRAGLQSDDASALGHACRGVTRRARRVTGLRTVVRRGEGQA